MDDRKNGGGGMCGQRLCKTSYHPSGHFWHTPLASLIQWSKLGLDLASRCLDILTQIFQNSLMRGWLFLKQVRSSNSWRESTFFYFVALFACFSLFVFLHFFLSFGFFLFLCINSWRRRVLSVFFGIFGISCFFGISGISGFFLFLCINSWCRQNKKLRKS